LFVAVIDGELQDRRLALDLAHDGFHAVLAGVVHELIGLPIAHQGAANPIIGTALLLPGFHAFPMSIPEILRQLLHAADQQISILDGLVARIILGMHAQNCRFDAQVDVFRDQGDARVAELLLQCQGIGEDGIVGAMPGQTVRQHRLEQLRLKKQSAARRPLAVIDGDGRRQGQAAIDLFLAGPLHQFIEEAAHLAHVAGRFRQPFLAGVEFLEHGHRNVNVVLFKAKDCRRVVHQYIRIEHENAALGFALAALQYRGPQRPHVAGHSAFTAANTAAA
jgi:hypothetical protein